MSSKLKEKVRTYLALRSDGICAHPECQVRLTQEPAGDDEGVIIGVAAHIFGEKNGSARFHPEKTIEFLNSAENLIYLCPNHHTLIDKQPTTYPAEMLISWKLDNERITPEVKTKKNVELAYDELQLAAKFPSRESLLEEIQEARYSEEYRDSTQNIVRTKHDFLTPMLAELGQIDNEVRRRVLGYSRWYEPASKDRIFQKLAVLGHERELVENNARHLQNDGLIMITENHYLPLNEKICQQAAEFLMVEILQELEE